MGDWWMALAFSVPAHSQVFWRTFTTSEQRLRLHRVPRKVTSAQNFRNSLVPPDCNYSLAEVFAQA
jgi:hypothetical protein